MKKIFFLIFGIICSISAFSKSDNDSIITNFLENGTAWVTAVLTNDFQEKGGYGQLLYSVIKGDTIVNGKKFLKIFDSGWNMFDSYYSRAYSSENNAIRLDEDGHLSKYNYHSRLEYDIYHFGSQFEIGKTIDYNYFDMENDCYVYLTDTIFSIDTLLLDNKYMVLVSNDKFIYGLGHKDYPIEWYSHECYYDYSKYDRYYSKNQFLCFFYKGEIIIQNDKLMDMVRKKLGIEDVNSIITLKKEDDKSPLFDLQGRKVQNPANGLYIKDGKKVVVK